MSLKTIDKKYCQCIHLQQADCPCQLKCVCNSVCREHKGEDDEIRQKKWTPCHNVWLVYTKE